MAKTCMHIYALFCNYRYVSHCVNNFKALKTLMEKSSSAIGFIIGLGETFTQDSHDEMGTEICLKSKEILIEEVPPRAQTCYGMLIWFVFKGQLQWKNHPTFLLDKKL